METGKGVKKGVFHGVPLDPMTPSHPGGIPSLLKYQLGRTSHGMILEQDSNLDLKGFRVALGPSPRKAGVEVQSRGGWAGG